MTDDMTVLAAEYEAANDRFIKALRYERQGIANKPSSLIWQTITHTNHHNPRYAGSYFTRRDEMVSKLWVSRDPCVKCGIRRDLGCKHHPLVAA